ncbi:matrix-remodeling-associated protein 5-like isoform X1 [Electrophorus electricus]|uniref:matrix-remodeling-associated protein 5-like isoform X1 n=1 Tax=Electrophorus electricus TaxID=8005 RepID=UPI0015D04E5D|nr:matrix-remodeling-associated protein 5-like isoform X1 [Electrophorus electricus]
MAPLGDPAPWLKVALLLLLLFLSACLCACPRSCSCPNPKEVHCTFRHLPSLPRNLPKDTERLNLGYNSIAAVGPLDYEKLRQLEMLMLHGNDITSVASGSFYHLRYLQILKLSYNKLKTIDHGMFKGMSSLVRLHLDHNLIGFIEPFSFTGLPSLKLLQLEGNMLHDLHPHTFTTLSVLGTFWGSGLRHLHLAGNQLEYFLPGTLQHLSRLELLSLHSNPWICDCHIRWLLEWDKKHEGVIKCKKDQDAIAGENCAACASPQPLNSSQVLQLSAQQLSCNRPSILSPLRTAEGGTWEDQEPDVPYVKDLEHPLGHLTFTLSDSHGNRAHVACDVTRPTEGTLIAWEQLKGSRVVEANVTLLSLLECEIDRDALQNLWRLVAYYYESPAILVQGARLENTSKATFQYFQATSEDSPYFTELKGHLMADPDWLLQPRVTLQLNRRKTTTKKLVLNFSTFISKHISERGEQEDKVSSWALILRGTPRRIQIALEHSEVTLDCNVLSSGHQSMEWMLPDLTTLEKTDSHRIVSEHNRLVIKNTSLSDSGLYHCFVRTETDVDIISYRLTVRERLLSPSDLNGKKMSVDYGESLILPCSVTSPQPVETRWILPKHEILNASDAKGRIHVSQNNTLIIKNVLDEDTGEYSCLAANLHGVDMLSHMVVVASKKEEDSSVSSVVEGESHFLHSEDTEGSGYQEIKYPTAKQTPQRTDGKHRGSGGVHRRGFKGKRIKEQPNKYVKEFDPDRWPQIFVKANAKVSTVQPATIITTQGETTTVKITTPAPMSPYPTTAFEFRSSSATSSAHKYYFSSKQLVQAPHREHTDYSSAEQEQIHQKSVNRFNTPSLASVHLSTTLSPINSNLAHVTQPEKQTDIHLIEERIRANSNPTLNQRRRPPYRRRLPPRRPRPQKPMHPPPTTTKITLTTSSSTAAPLSPMSSFFQMNNKNTGSRPVTDSEILSELDPRIKNPVNVTVIEMSPQLNKKTKLSHEGKLVKNQDKNKYNGSVELMITAPITLAPMQNKWYKHENREDIGWTSNRTNKNKYIQRIITTSSPSIQITNTKLSITEKDPLTTEKPALINISRKNVDNSAVKPEIPELPIHPWLTQRRNQISPVSRTYTPSPFWTYTNHIPVWPTIHGSRQHSSSDRIWHLPHTKERRLGITNRPEITAQTAKPTAYIPWSAVTALPLTVAPHSSTSSRVRDYLLLSRLRNKYRQSQLDAYRLVQLGKPVTLKPRTYQPTPRPHPAPNFPSIHKPVTSPSVVAATSKPHTTASILYGSRWHYSQFGTKKLSTALPFPDLLGSGAKPRIIATDTVSVSALAEANVLLRCQSSGDPKPAISWTKVSTGATIQASTKHGQRFEVLPNGTFVIKNVQLQDRGQYLCTAQNKFGSDRMVLTLAIQTEPPKIQGPKHRDISVYLGKPISLDCTAAGKPQAQVSWILPDRTFVREIVVLDRPISLFPNGTLRIRYANFSSKGDYKCIASNAAGADTLTYHLHVAALPPTINEEASESISLNAGRSIYVHCTAKGEPEPLLKWVLPDSSQMKPTQFIERRLFVFPNGTLYVKSVSPTDTGRYECLAANVVGITKRVVELDVQQEAVGPWKGLVQQHHVSAMYGSMVFLHCPESTRSHRGTVWRLPSRALLEPRQSPQRHITAFSNGTLRILQLTEKDGGSYLCMYQKPNGEEIELFQLEVLMKPPKIENIGTPQKRVTNGDNFLVDCVASGLPDPEVSWSLPDGTVINNALQSDDSGTRSRRYTIFGNGTLLLQQMGENDEGDYTCYAKNTLGEDAMKVSVEVIPNSPQISSKDHMSLWASLGQSVQMKCDATGEPVPTIIWISPNNEIITSSSVKYQILNDGTLIIKKVTLADQGKYACVARNSAGDDIKNVNLQVEVREPHINGKRGQTASKILAVSYQTLLLHCTAEGMPEPQVTWTTSYGMSLPTPYVGGRFQVHKNGTLELRGLRKTDEGKFLCVAKNYLGEASLVIDLEVASLAEKPSFPVPNIEVLPLKLDGDDITLKCQAVGRPKPEFVWILPNTTVLASGMKLKRFIHSSGNGTLYIIQPVPSDKGVYRCLAKNVAGQAEKRYALEPGKKPQIRSTASSMKISLGQTLSMPCTVDGWPQATITWTLPNGLVLDRPQVIGRVTYLSNGTLHLREIAKFDRGTYTCKATNMFGSSSLSYPVTIMVFPPQITNPPPSIIRVAKGSPVTLNCIAAGIPKPDISWTLPGRTTLVPNNRFTALGGIHMTKDGSLVIQDPSLMNSGIYKCNAKNALGTDFKATYLQVI